MPIPIRKHVEEFNPDDLIRPRRTGISPIDDDGCGEDVIGILILETDNGDKLRVAVDDRTAAGMVGQLLVLLYRKIPRRVVDETVDYAVAVMQQSMATDEN